MKKKVIKIYVSEWWMKFLFLLIVFFCKNVFRMKKKFLKVDYILFIFEELLVFYFV